MAFKMKSGKEGPMKKNFPGAFKNTTVEVGDNQITATKKGLTVTGAGGKVSKYKPNTGAYDAVKQQYIDAGGESPMGMKSPKKLGSSTGMSGAQGRAKNVKPLAFDEKFRNYTDVGNAGSAMSMKSPKKISKAAASKENKLAKTGGEKKDPAMMMKKSAMTMKKSAMAMEKAAMKMMKKSPKKAKAKKAASGPGVAVYNDQGQLHAKYMPGEVGYNQAKFLATNTASAMNMKSPKKVVKTNTRKSAMKISQATMNPTQAKKTASTRRKKNVGK